MTTKIGSKPLRKISWDEEDLYPGDVEDAMPEGNLPRLLASYIVEIIFRVLARSRKFAAYANLPIYYEEGSPRKHVSPDAFFVDGVAYAKRLRSYQLWKAHVVPQVVFEIVSERHEKKDVEENRRLYAQLGVSEYYWFNPKSGKLCALQFDTATHSYQERQPNC